jgi:hypothetical protein
MDPVTYLTTPQTGAGALEWVFFAAQVLVAIAGVYLAFLQRSQHPVRARAQRQLGYALLAVGLVGAVVGALRIGGVMPFTMPVWIAVATLFNVLLAGFALYYARAVYPAQLAAYEQASRGRSGRPGSRTQVGSAANTSRPAARPITRTPPDTNGVARPASPPSTRREARRDRKRKSR